MRRAGCLVALLGALGITALAIAAYRQHDYRARFARAAGELIAVRDSTAVGSTPDGYRLTDVTLVSDTGLRVRIRVRSPGLRDGVRRPAALLVGGYKSGLRAAEIPPTTGGLVLASIEYPGEYEDRPRGVEWFWGLPHVRRAMMQTPSSLLLAAQYLYARGDVDPERVSIIGVSLGVPFATVAAATDRRLAGAALLHGGGDLRLLFLTTFGDRLPPWARAPASHGVAFLLAPLEPTKYAGAIAPRPLLMVNATDDDAIPRSSVVALYRAARRPKRLVWIESRHVAVREEQAVATLMGETLAWMEERGLR